MKFLTSLFALISLSAACAAQSVVAVSNASGRYHARITGLKCEGNNCSGAAKVQLLEKERNRAVQTLSSKNLLVTLDGAWQKGDKQAFPAEGQHPLVFDDFNFDGEEDVAVRNGSEGSNGSPSYDVYVYDASRKNFSLDKQLTRLASENEGMFETDRRRMQLVVYRKEGCCRHTTTTYGAMPGKGIIKVAELIEQKDAGGENVTVTTSTLVNGKMKKSVKLHKASEYYKDGVAER